MHAYKDYHFMLNSDNFQSVRVLYLLNGVYCDVCMWSFLHMMYYHLIAMKMLWSKIVLGRQAVYTRKWDFPRYINYAHADIRWKTQKWQSSYIYVLYSDLYSGCVLWPVSQMCVGGQRTCMKQSKWINHSHSVRSMVQISLKPLPPLWMFFASAAMCAP